MHGSIAIIAAFSLSALIGMMALAMDLTRLFMAQSELQVVADSCALAGMAALPCAQISIESTHCAASDYGIATQAGEQLASHNATSGYADSVEVSFPENNRVACQVQREGFMPALMQLFGVGEQVLQAHAVATLWPKQSSCSACSVTHFPGAVNQSESPIPVLVQ